MTDNDLINNKFDFVVWFCNIFFYSILRVYYLSSLDIIKRTLSNITPENLRKVLLIIILVKIQIITQLNMFSLLVLAMNVIYTSCGLFLFHKVGVYALSLLFFGGFNAGIQYIKINLMTKAL